MFHTVEEALSTFDYHKPDDGQIERIAEVRRAHKRLVVALWSVVPSGPDRTAAIRKIHESMMTCNKAIVLEGEVAG